MVPTPDKILLKNGYFWKQVVLIREKPCNLAAFFSPQKAGGSTGRAEHLKGQECVYCQKLRGSVQDKNRVRFFGKISGIRCR